MIWVKISLPCLALTLYWANFGKLFTSCRAEKIIMAEGCLIQSLNRQYLRCECMEFDKIKCRIKRNKFLKTTVFYLVFTLLLNLPAKEMSVIHKRWSFNSCCFFIYPVTVTEQKHAGGSTCLYSHFSSTHHNQRWT